MKKIHKLLKDYVKSSKNLYSMPQAKLVAEWPSIVGDFLSEHIQPVSFEKGTLVCLISHSALMQEKKHLEPQILSKIHEYKEGQWIKKLKFTLISNPSEQAYFIKVKQTHNQRELQSKFKIEQKLSIQEIETIKKSLSEITDKETESRLFKLFKSIKIKQKSLASQGWHICEACQGYFEPEFKSCPSCLMRNYRGHE